MIPRDRPGLLLLCHGDLPESLAEDPGARQLYARCAESLECTVPAAAVPPDLNDHIASYLAAESDGPVEQAFIAFGRPGLREATFRLVARGCRSIVCAGGAGMVLPGQGAVVHLPDAVRRVQAENAGLDLSCAPPGINPRVASALVMASIERSLTGRGIPPGPSWEAPRIGGDTGVIVASSPLQLEHVSPAKQLSDYLQANPIESPAPMTGYMSMVARELEASGAFCAVRPGYMDFALPDVTAAACQLAGAGARQIIVTGMPALLGRHLLSWASPDAAVDRLKKSCPVDLVYIKPDPQSCAPEIASILRMRVLEAATAARQQSFSHFS